MRKLLLGIGVTLLLIAVSIEEQCIASDRLFELIPCNIDGIYQEIDEEMHSIASDNQLVIRITEEDSGWNDLNDKILQEGDKYQVWIEQREEQNFLVIIKK